LTEATVPFVDICWLVWLCLAIEDDVIECGKINPADVAVRDKLVWLVVLDFMVAVRLEATEIVVDAFDVTDLADVKLVKLSKK